jgi:hypothetical protein
MRACRQIFVFQGNKKQGLGFGAGVIKKKANDLLMRSFSLEVINSLLPAFINSAPDRMCLVPELPVARDRWGPAGNHSLGVL